MHTRQGQPAPFSKLHSRTLAKVLVQDKYYKRTDLLEAIGCTHVRTQNIKESVASLQCTEKNSKSLVRHPSPKYENLNFIALGVGYHLKY